MEAHKPGVLKYVAAIFLWLLLAGVGAKLLWFFIELLSGLSIGSMLVGIFFEMVVLYFAYLFTYKFIFTSLDLNKVLPWIYSIGTLRVMFSVGVVAFLFEQLGMVGLFASVLISYLLFWFGTMFLIRNISLERCKAAKAGLYKTETLPSDSSVSKGFVSNEQVLVAPDDSGLYEVIADELDSKEYDRGLWTRLFAEKDGDEAKVKAEYIRIRFDELKAGREVYAGLVAAAPIDAVSTMGEVGVDQHIEPRTETAQAAEPDPLDGGCLFAGVIMLGVFASVIFVRVLIG